MRRQLAAVFLVLTLIVVAGQSAPVYAQAAPQADAFKIYLPAIQHGAAPTPDGPAFPSVAAFADSVADGAAHTVRGVYAANVLALPVVQQPENNAGYVAPQSGVVTQFSLAAIYGVTGLLAHNYAAGDLFDDLALGQPVYMVYGDGSVKAYVVNEILRFQALQPYSTTSDFVDLETGQTLTAGEVFARVYMGRDQVTFQTCIAQNGNSSWGRLFVIATPAD